MPNPFDEDRLSSVPQRDLASLFTAAAAGLFLKDDRAFRSPWTKSSFEQRDHQIRPATASDLPRLVELESACWPVPLMQSSAALARRIRRVPEGQLVVVVGGEIVGAVYSQRIADAEVLRGETMETVEGLHRPDGVIVQLLALNVFPAMQDRGLGDRLLVFMLQRARLAAGIEKVVGVTRCRDYTKHSDVKLEDYVHLRTRRGSLVDATLRFHELHGAQIVCIVPGYRKDDAQNAGAGVLVSYELSERGLGDEPCVPNPNSYSAKAPAGPKNIVTEVNAAVRSMLGPDREDAFAVDRPLMEMGLDSCDLLELNERLSSAFGRDLDPGIFFEHNTAARVAAFLGGRLPKPGEFESSRQVDGNDVDRDECSQHVTPLAIVGMACRLPGSIHSPVDLWRALCDGRDCVGVLPEGRWKWPSFIDPEGEHEGINRGGFIDDPFRFDPQFFRITPREAESMDPQQCILLELSWACLEDAGYAPSRLAGSKTGVYVGASGSDHAKRMGAQEDVDARYGLATAMSVLANRLSYYYDFRGPSVHLDTACSSSLVAVHAAARALQAGDCEMAMVGGIHLMTHPALSIAYYRAGMLSKRGCCRTFDADADGYVRSEGAAMMLVKPLSKALADSDDIYAVIRGSAVNHGGLASGLTVPNPARQASLIVDAYADAGIDPKTVGYLEAHGTGTPMGDPIEFRGLCEAFADGKGEDRVELRQCGLGSVKTNLGHLEAAAGIVGLMKVALSLRARKRVASLHCERINPRIELTNSRFFICDRVESWPLPAGQSLRCGSVSSFGSGGTNAHVVLEEHDVALDPKDFETPASTIIVLSAKTLDALQRRARQLRDHLATHDESSLSLSALAFTLQTCRQPLECRLAFAATNLGEVLARLTAFLDDGARATELYLGRVNEGGVIAELFDDDEDLRGAVGQWLEKRKDHRLMELWVQGGHVPWSQLYAGRRWRKLRLPSYPFDAGVQRGDGAGPSRVRSAYSKRWVPAPQAVGCRRCDEVVIFANAATESLAWQIVRRLGHVRSVSVSSPGEGVEVSKSSDGIIDLVGCSCDDAMALDWWGTLQSRLRAGRDAPLRLLAVTRGLEQGSRHFDSPAGATRAALHRMLSAEYSFVDALHLDLDHDCSEADESSTIAAEFLMDGPEVAVCYRRGVRHRPELEAITLPAIDPRARNFPADSTLLVTGGTRGLGWLSARHFVTHYGVRKLVLTGRTDIPPRSEWASRADEDSPLGDKLRGFLELESLGAEVSAQGLDLANAVAVERAAASWGRIGGVVHAAGRADWDDLVFVSKSVSGVKAILQPKILGTANLFEALQGQPLAFFMLFSSVSAALPNLAVGQSDYSIANAFLDYFAMSRRAAFRVVSVQWPSWKESGMGEVTTPAYQRSGLKSITDVEGLTFMDEILASGEETVVLPAVHEGGSWNPSAALDPTPKRSESPREADGARSLDEVPARKTELAIHSWLLDIFARELGIEREDLDLRTEFQNYGVDSILLAQVLKKINEILDADLSPSLMYEYPTLASLATAIEDRHELTSFVEPATVRLDHGAPPIVAPRNSSFVDSMQPGGHEIAVVGMSCRFAGAAELDELWDLLVAGRSALGPVPYDKWGRATNFFAGLLDRKASRAKSGQGLVPEDAQGMDPQALLLLDECANLIRHAGWRAEALEGSATGVFLGARSDHRPSPELLARMRNPILGMGQNYLAANLSQRFDFRGPSMVVDTACSSAMVALNLAVRSLHASDIDQAIVGGVSLLSDDRMHRLFAQRGLLSPDQYFHLFDRRAHGVVLGEGVGMVLLKSVQDAIRDGDCIYAVLRAVECNNDGRTAGPASPSVKGQRAVIQRALERSGIDRARVGYVELNGTGSEVTDLIELETTLDAYGQSSTAGICALGSIKANIGHTLCAEGMAALIKVVSMLNRSQLLPFSSGLEPMKHFNLDGSGLYFARRAEPWPTQRPIAAVNCFADGGTNAHALLQAWRETRPEGELRRPLAAMRGVGATKMSEKKLAPHTNRWKRIDGQ